jgi:hypothetical protein
MGVSLIYLYLQLLFATVALLSEVMTSLNTAWRASRAGKDALDHLPLPSAELTATLILAALADRVK